MDDQQIFSRIKELRPWFQNIEIRPGIWTKDLNDPTNIAPGLNNPSHVWGHVADLIPKDLRGKRVLDIGCNAGFFSFKMAERGADVVGIDTDQEVSKQSSFIDQARFCNEVMGLHVDFRKQDLLELGDPEGFDVILFLGVLYHVANFCDAISQVADLAKKGAIVLVESEIGERSTTYYGNKTYHGDPSTFFVPSVNIMLAMLLEYGLEPLRDMLVMGGPKRGRQVVLCQKASSP